MDSVDKVLSVGQMVEVRERGRERTLPARLSAVGDRTFALSTTATVPQTGSSWKTGDRLQLRLLTDNGVISFETVITDLAPERMIVRKPVRVERVQRREFLRVSDAIGVRVSYRPSALDPERHVRCTSVDISGGGLRLRPEALLVRPPKVGQFVELQITLTAAERPVAARAKVVRYHHDSAEFIVQFTNLEDRERTRVVRHVNARHAELARRRS